MQFEYDLLLDPHDPHKCSEIALPLSLNLVNIQTFDSQYSSLVTTIFPFKFQKLTVMTAKQS